MSDRKRQRSRSPPSINQLPPEERIPDGRHYIVINRGGPGRGPRVTKTARKRVKYPIFFGPAPRDDATVGDTDDIELENIMQYSDSDAESSAPVVELAFDPHPNHELWERFKDFYLNAFNEYTSFMQRYTAFLGSVKKLYEQKEEHGLEMTDDIWIQTTLAYFPDITSWIEKKNEIIFWGPFEFWSFINHMYMYVLFHTD